MTVKEHAQQDKRDMYAERARKHDRGAGQQLHGKGKIEGIQNHGRQRDVDQQIRQAFVDFVGEYALFAQEEADCHH